MPSKAAEANVHTAGFGTKIRYTTQGFFDRLKAAYWAAFLLCQILGVRITVQYIGPLCAYGGIPHRVCSRVRQRVPQA